jgi:hypothetical protein
MAANAMDERVALLTLVCRSRWFLSISTEELKLYLLLLVSAARIGQEEQIAWEVVRRGMGGSVTVETIERLSETLNQYGLARVRVTRAPDVGGRRRGDVAPVVHSTVFGVERLRGPASRGSRLRWRRGDG